MGDLPPESVPVSMLLRQDLKKKHTRSGVAALIVGLALVGFAVYAFMLGGAEVIGVLASAFGAGFVGVGGWQLRKASQSP